MATMHEVAREAGVSPMTVSNVINGYPHVSDKTREKVNLAIEKLGYKVNIAARNLRAGRTGTIGLYVPELDRPYFGQLAANISEVAARHGFRVAVQQTGATREQEISALVESRKRMYDGLILSTVALGPDDADLLKVDYPVVILGERIFAGPADHVAMPNVDGMYSATKHLIEQGCRNIAILGGPYAESGSDVGSLRLQGYQKAIVEAGLNLDEELIVNLPAFTMNDARLAVKKLTIGVGEVDGIVCVTDTVALGALRGLHEVGRRVPEETKVIGFDALDQGEFSIPTLSSVDPGHGRMAQTAVEMLLDRINNPGADISPREVTSEFELRLRESTGN